MAEGMEEDEPLPLQNDLTCSVCISIFRDPVLLPCSHSFCRECLQQSSERSRRCPLCREPYAAGQDVTNRSLCGASDTFLKHASSLQSQKPVGDDTCRLHLKRLELYCEKDEQPVCVDCVALHNTHTLWPVTHAAPMCKRELGLKVQIFEKKVELYKKMTRKLSSAVEHIKQQAGQAETQIRAEFQRLRAALDREEALRLNALGAEEQQKITAIQELVENTDKDVVALKELIETLKKEMGNEDLPLVQNFQKLKRQAQWPGEERCFPDDSLLNMGKHVGSLSFNIWKRMQAHAKYNHVVFDPNTASPWLCLTDDLTQVKESSERLSVPDNPERFEPCVFVLGAEGYTSGKHRWDVVVGDNPKWIVGVCRESVIRKKKFTISTSRGLWCIALTKGVYSALTPERTELQVQQRLESVRIKLNMDSGEVSFWDGGAGKHLVTLNHRFDEKIFPIFGPGLHSSPMSLTPGKMAVHTS